MDWPSSKLENNFHLFDSGIRLIEGMSPNDPDRVLRSDELTQIMETFDKMADVFKKIDMPVSLELLSEVHSNPP